MPKCAVLALYVVGFGIRQIPKLLMGKITNIFLQKTSKIIFPPSPYKAYIFYHKYFVNYKF